MEGAVVSISAKRCRLCGAAAMVLAVVLSTDVDASEKSGCAVAFPAGMTVTLSGKTTPGKKNKISHVVDLSLTAGPSSAAGVPFIKGRANERP